MRNTPPKAAILPLA